MSEREQQEEQAADRKQRKQQSERKGVLFFLVFVGVLGCLILLVVFLVGWDDPLNSRLNPETDDAYANGDYTPLSPRVEGYLVRLDVDDNQAVRAGQTIAELESDDYAAAVRAAAAAVDAARAQVSQIDAQIGVAQLQVRQSELQATGYRAEHWQAALELQRQRILLPTALGLARTLDNATAEFETTAAQTMQADATTAERRRSIEVLAAQRTAAAAEVDVRQAALDLARIQLGYTVLRAPRDGVVGERQVRIGSLLQPGMEVVSLTPLDTVWVDADFTERQITDMRVGQAAEVRFDTYPGEVLLGHVVGMSPLTGQQMSPLPPDNTTGNYTKVVQRIPVKIGLDDQAGALHDRVRPGMSAIVRVMTEPGSPVLAPVVPVR